MSVTTIEYQTSLMDTPECLTIHHRHKVRAELAAARRGWPVGTTAPLALMTLSAHFAALDADPSTPRDFDTWMDTLDHFEFIEQVEPDPTPAALVPEPPSN